MPQPETTGPPIPIPAAEQKRKRDWMKAHGISVAEANKLNLTTRKNARKATCDLLKIDEQMYRDAGGRAWDEE